MLRVILPHLFQTFLDKNILSRWVVLFIDFLIIVGCTIFSCLMSIQAYKNLGSEANLSFVTISIYSIGVNFLFFVLFRTYKGVIRFSSVNDFSRIICSLVVSEFLLFVIFVVFLKIPTSLVLAYTCVLFMSSLIGLLGFRMIVVQAYRYISKDKTKSLVAVYAWGVNPDNVQFAQTINDGKSRYRVKGLIDIDPNFKVNNGSSLSTLNYNEIDIVDSLKGYGVLFTNRDFVKDRKDIVERLVKERIPIYFTQDVDITNPQQLKEALNTIRTVQIEDLLGREQIEISLGRIGQELDHKIVLVTGAAGSIGSEIVRQIAKFNPSKIICLDQAETPLNDLGLELTKKFPSLNFVTIIGDVKNKAKLEIIFSKYKPQVIYHAAAYKHVPMMEINPSEAIKTNVLGTKVLVDMSVEYNVGMFVMVSTDKAVNPTNIMGASKRIAEIYVQSMAMKLKIEKNTNTKFVTTRFGNVLGSNGSVIPLFRRQIEKGGPLTVTHPDIIRYFMTIPEACRLVLEASVIGASGYIYIFDMGEPMKILDLANRMIVLAGLRPDIDIKIEFSGLRPGEKLFEELLADEEASEKTSHPKVMRSKVREYCFGNIEHQIDAIIENALEEHTEPMVLAMKALVPEFISKNSDFEKLDKH